MKNEGNSYFVMVGPSGLMGGGQICSTVRDKEIVNKMNSLNEKFNTHSISQ